MLQVTQFLDIVNTHDKLELKTKIKCIAHIMKIYLLCIVWNEQSKERKINCKKKCVQNRGCDVCCALDMAH